MPNKCCVAFCNSNYDSSKDSYVTVYSFPNNEEERKKWLNAIPNKIENLSKSMKVCSRHWPPNAPMKKAFQSRMEVRIIINFNFWYGKINFPSKITL